MEVLQLVSNLYALEWNTFHINMLWFFTPFYLQYYMFMSFPHFSKLKETGAQFKLPSRCLCFHLTWYMSYYWPQHLPADKCDRKARAAGTGVTFSPLRRLLESSRVPRQQLCRIERSLQATLVRILHYSCFSRSSMHSSCILFLKLLFTNINE